MPTQTARKPAPDPKQVEPELKPGLGARLRLRKGGAGKRQTVRNRSAPIPTKIAAGVERWLDWQCRMLAGVHRGAVFLVTSDDAGVIEPVSDWPRSSRPTPALRNLAVRCFTEARSVVQKALDEVGNETEVFDYIAYPLMRGEQVTGVVSMALQMRSEGQRQAVMQLLQWGMTWLDSVLHDDDSEALEISSLVSECTALLARDLPIPVVGHDFCSLLADKLQCARVALGLSSGLQVRLVALSHQVRFDRRVTRVTALEAAMEECADQDRSVTQPSAFGDDPSVSHAHSQLLRDETTGAVCSVPLRLDERIVGVLTLIRAPGEHFEPEAMELLTAVAERLAPVVDLKQRETRPTWRKTLHGAGRKAGRLVGRGHLKTKLVAAFLLLLIAGLALVQTDHRVSARSSIEGRLQQVVSAPFAGYVKAAKARAGDHVSAGQVLAVLDERELLIEREKWLSERDKHRREYQEALAQRDRAKLSVLMARIAQAEAQLKLVDDRLERTELRAPFAGVIVSGDLSRSLGAPVDRGQVLFELVPEGGYRVDMRVDEHDVARLQPGQPGSLRLAGMADRLTAIEVSRIVPIADAKDGGNRFRVEAQIVGEANGLRPGMQGVAKVAVGHESLLRVWTHQLVQRLRLWAWSRGL
jgi:multidrug efflux pump subunit AcrA (membrane-fusion protein)